MSESRLAILTRRRSAAPPHVVRAIPRTNARDKAAHHLLAFGVKYEGANAPANSTEALPRRGKLINNIYICILSNDIDFADQNGWALRQTGRAQGMRCCQKATGAFPAVGAHSYVSNSEKYPL